jgi:hypothetical protein
MSQTINKLSTAQLGDVLQRCSLPEDALALVTGLPDAQAVIETLVANNYPLEATRVYAHALPKRESVWWACMCAGHTAPETLKEDDRKARDLAEQWVRNQKDETRRAAMDAARAAGMQSADSWAGVAAFWSGESIMPPNNPAVPPPLHLTGVAVSGAVALSSVRLKPERQKARLARFLESAQDIARGGPGRLPVESP